MVGQLTHYPISSIDGDGPRVRGLLCEDRWKMVGGDLAQPRQIRRVSLNRIGCGPDLGAVFGVREGGAGLGVSAIASSTGAHMSQVHYDLLRYSQKRSLVLSIDHLESPRWSLSDASRDCL